MKVLFLHAAQNGLTSEYKVHATLSNCARQNGLVPDYIWQSPIDPAWTGADRILAHDFGCRTLARTPTSRLRRWRSRAPASYPEDQD